MSEHSFLGYPVKVVDDIPEGTTQRIYHQPSKSSGNFPGYPIEVNDTEPGRLHPDGSYSYPVRSSQVVLLRPLEPNEGTHSVFRSQVVNLDDILED